MVLPAPAPDDEPALDGPAWLRPIAVALRILSGGVLLLVEGASDARLRELVRALAPRDPEIDVSTDVLQVFDAPRGSLVVFAAHEADLSALNLERPRFAHRALRVILWNRPGMSAAMVRRAPDFFDWISDVVECPPAAPGFAVAGLRAALADRAPGVVWGGGPIDEVFRSAFPKRALRRADAAGGFAALVDTVREAGRDWIAISGAGTPERVAFIEAALADAGRRSRVVLLDAGRCPAGFWPLHGVQMSLDGACRRLARARSRGCLAALADLEPEAIELMADLIDGGALEAEIEQRLLAAADPGAALAALAVERGRVGRDEIFSGAAASPPMRRAFQQEIRRALQAPASRRLPLRKGEAQGAARPEGMRRIEQATVTVEEGLRSLLNEARLLREGDLAAEALRAAERAREGARLLGALALEVVAAAELARARAAVGDDAAALAAWAWIAGMAADPARAHALGGEDARRAVAHAYTALDTFRAARRLPSGPTRKAR